MSQELEPIAPVLPAEYYFDERSSFDRLDGESKDEFKWFDHYRRLARGKRSYSDVAQFFGTPREIIQRTGQKHSWVLRARALDAALDDQRSAELDARQLEVREKHAEMARTLRERIMSRFETMDLYAISPRDMPAYLELAWKVERQAVGLSDVAKKIEITGKDGGPIEVVSNMTAAERRERMAELMDAMAKQIANEQAIEGEIEDAEVVDES